MEKNIYTRRDTTDGISNTTGNRALGRYFSYGFYWHNNATAYCANHVSRHVTTEFEREFGFDGEKAERVIVHTVRLDKCLTKADAAKAFGKLLKQPEIKALIKANKAWVKGA